MRVKEYELWLDGVLTRTVKKRSTAMIWYRGLVAEYEAQMKQTVVGSFKTKQTVESYLQVIEVKRRLIK